MGGDTHGPPRLRRLTIFGVFKHAFEAIQPHLPRVFVDAKRQVPLPHLGLTIELRVQGRPPMAPTRNEAVFTAEAFMSSGSLGRSADASSSA